jgi:UPF0755 protein
VTRRSWVLALIGLGLGIGVAAATAIAAWVLLTAPEEAQRTIIVVEAGERASQVAGELEEAGLIRSREAFVNLMRLTGADRKLKPGEYAFEGGELPLEIVEKLVEGRVVTARVTVPEGLTLEETVAVFVRQGVGPADALREAFRDPGPIADLDREAENLEGYLFPETYQFRKPVDPEKVAETMVQLFRDRFYVPRRAAIEAHERSLRQLVTLASLVEKETAIAEEKPRIAGVFAARLDRGMRLQCDPTIVYGLKMEDRWDGNIRRRDLSWPHPYNTYVHAGLPPGPIASPGLAALEAALEPKRTGDLYFVARGDGRHDFSRTFAEHRRKVRELMP